MNKAYRTVAAATLIWATAFTLVQAQDAQRIQRDSEGPTETMTKRVPEMNEKSNAPDNPAHPPTNRVGDAVPPMRPDDEATAKPTDPAAGQQAPRPESTTR